MDTSSFASRRPAATALPAFSLPSPSPGHEIPRVTSDGLSPSPGVHTGSSQSSQHGYYPSIQGTPWQSAGNSAYTYATTSSASPNPAQTSLAHPSPYGQGRSSMLQSSMSFMARPSQTLASSAGEPLPPPPPPPPPQQQFQHHPEVPTLPSYQTTLSSSGGGPSQQPSSGSQLQNPTTTLSSQQNAVTQAPTPASSAAGGDFRPPPTPGYSAYPSSSTPSQPGFASYAPQPSPTHPHPHSQHPQHPHSQHPSPTTSGGLSRGLASVSAGPPLSGMAAPQMGYGGPPPGSRPAGPGYPYGHHQLPGVAAPVMSNIGNPGGQMALVGGVSGMSLPPGFGPHGHPLMFSHGQQPSQERPFKCDTCPQSFNRNHDLKRHKRIHLAVKPFPCTFCEKSFSRKDALKRHRLVKGCGGGDRSGGDADPSSGGHDSDVKLENDHSPRMPKQEQEQ